MLILISYLSFSQTIFYQGLTQTLASGLLILLPDMSGYMQVAQILIALILFAISVTVALLGKRKDIKHLCYFSFLLFLPTTQTFSTINWLSFIGVENTILSYSTLAQTLFSGIILLFCYFLLNSISRFKEIRSELTQRGGADVEVNKAINNGVALTMIVAALSLFLAAIAAFLLVTTQSFLTGLASALPYYNIILGISSIISIIALIYYYLKEHN